MSYQVLCTFDLKRASSQEYEFAYSDLGALGLHKAQANSAGGQTVIPTTTVLGDGFTGTSATEVAQRVREQVRAAFTRRGLTSEIFVVAGWNGTWSSCVT